jgi:hypothetical protein
VCSALSFLLKIWYIWNQAMHRRNIKQICFIDQYFNWVVTKKMYKRKRIVENYSDYLSLYCYYYLKRSEHILTIIRNASLENIFILLKFQKKINAWLNLIVNNVLLKKIQVNFLMCLITWNRYLLNFKNSISCTC